MADDKILSSLTNIGKDVKGIHGQVKKFGPKLPSGNSEEDELIDEAQLNTFTALAGLLGVLFGKKVTKLGDVTQIINKSTTKDNLFVVLKNFVDAQINPKDLYRKDSILDKFIKQSIGAWTTEFKKSIKPLLQDIYGQDFTYLSDIFDTIDNLDLDGKFQELVSAIEELQDIIKNNKPLKEEKSELALGSTDILDNYVGEIKALLTAVNESVLKIDGKLPKDLSELIKQKEEEIAKGKIDIELISNTQDLNTLIETIKSFSENSENIDANFENIIKSINSLVNLIDNLNSELEKIDANKIARNISNIIEVLGKRGDNKETNGKNLHTLITNLMGIIPDASESATKKQDVQAAIDLIGTLTKIQSMKIGVSDISTILDSYIKITEKGGQMSKLFDNIRELGDVAINPDTEKSLKAIEKLFDLLQKDLYISPFKAIRIKFGLMNFRVILSKEFVKLTKSLEGLAKLSEEQNNSIVIINNLIEAISKIGDLGIFRQIKMMLNIKFLKSFLIKDIKDLLDEVRDSLSNSDADAIATVLENIDTIFNSLVNIGNIDIKEYGELKQRINYLMGILKDDLPEIIKQISSYKVELESIENISKYLDNVKHMLGALPGMFLLLGSILKLDLLNSNVIPQLNQSTILLSNLRMRSDMEALEFWDVLKYELSELENINTIISDNKTYKQTIKTIKSEMIPELVSIENFLMELNKLLEISIDKDSIKNLNEVITKFNELPFDNLPQTSVMNTVDEIVLVIKKIFEDLPKEKIDQNLLSSVIEDYTLLIMSFDKDTDLGKAITNIAVIKKSDFENLKNLAKYLNELNKIGKILVAVDSAEKILTGIETLVKMVININEKLNNAIKNVSIDQDQIKELSNGIKELMKVVVMSAALLIIAGMALMVVPIANIFMFTVTLTMFVGTILGVFGYASKYANPAMETLDDLTKLVVGSALVLIFGGLVAKLGILGDAFIFAMELAVFVGAITFLFAKASSQTQKAIEGLEDFTMLVVASGLVLILGSVIYHFIKWEDLFGFTIAVGAFIFAMTFTVAMFADQLKESLEGVKDLAILVVATGLTIALGSFMFKWVDWASAFLFVGATLLFTVAIVTIFGLLDSKLGILDPFRQALEGVKDLAILVIAAGLTLALGSFVYKYVDIASAFLFTAVLAGFIIAVMMPFILAKSSGMIGLAEKSGKEFGILLLFSTLVLMIGGLLFTLYPQIIPGTALFALVLGGFVWGVCTAFSKVDAEKIWPKAVAILLITVISGAVLLYAGKLIADNPNMAWAVPLFAVTLFGYLMGMTLVLKVLNNIKGDLIKGVIAIGLLCVVTMLAAKAIEMAAEMVHKYSWAEIGGGILALITGIGLIGLAYWAFGYAAFLDGGLGLGLAALALTAISGLSFLTVNALMYVTKHQKDIKVTEVKKFRNAIKAMGGLAEELVDQFGSLKMIFVLPTVSASVTTLGFALSQIAKAVADYSSLVVPEYEGKKIIRYRKLTSKDFNQAARNVKQIITVLGGAVIDTYDRKPEIFETNFFGRSKFATVTKSLKTLGPMLSTIAKAVKNYASLTIPEYKGGKEVVSYRKLGDEDFKAAARNVSVIITTLGGAVIDTYDKKPEIFETNFWGTSKFSKVTKSLKTLAPLISSIAKSVQTYANLKVADYGDVVEYDKNGNPKIKKYLPLTDQDFVSAATNVQTIISTLGGAIIACYDAKPEMYDSGLFRKSKFAKVVDANITLAKLISRIGKAVADMSNLKVATDWYTEGDNIGKPKKYEQLDNKHFKNASDNILTIITTLGKPIEKIAGDPKLFELYNSTSGFIGIGGNKSKFIKVIDGNIKLATLISRIGKAVADMANLKVATEWYTEGEHIGKPKKYEQLDNKHFSKASQNILTVITTLGKPIQKIAADQKQMELFESSSGFLGIGKKKSKFVTVIDGNLKLAGLISKIGSAIKDVSQLKLVTGYDKEGKPTGYKVMGQKEFTQAADNINKIITTLSNSIIQTYKKNPKLFEDGEDSDFAKANTAIGSMGQMISSIAGGISAYAQLRIPDWTAGTNSDGTPKKYLELNNKTFKAASESISAIISNIGKTVIDEYKKHDKWFDDGEDSDFAKACTAISSMGTMLGSISEGIKAYAELRIPTEYDKQGNPIKFRDLTNKDFENASQNIGYVVSTIGKAVMEMYTGKINGVQVIDAKLAKEMFDYDPEKSTDSIFAKVVQACTNIGDMIGSIAEGVQMYAEMKMPTGFDKEGKPIGYTKLDETTFTKAANTIGNIISVIGGAIDKTFYEHRNWFELPPLKKKGGFLGLGTVEEPNPSDPPFTKAVKGLSLMGNMIGSIAQGVQTFAAMKMPVEFAPDGTPTKYIQMDDAMYERAAVAIGKVVTSLGSSIDRAYWDNMTLFNNPNINKIMYAFTQMGQIISSMSRGVQEYAKLSIPDEIDPVTGKGKNYRKVEDSDFVTAGAQVAKVLTCIGQAIEDVAEGKTFQRWNSSKTLETVTNMYAKIVPTISNLANVIKQFASLSMPTGFDKNGKALGFEKMKDTDITAAGDAIGKVLTAIGQGIVNAIGDHPELFGQNGLEAIFNKKSVDELPVMVAAKAISTMATPIVQIAGVLKSYSGSQFFDPSDKEHKNPLTLSQDQINKAKDNMSAVISSLGEVMWQELTQSSHKDIYTKQSNIESAKGVMDLTISIVSEIISGFMPIFTQLGQQITLGKKQTTVLNAFTDMVGDKPEIQDNLIKVINVVGSLGQAIAAKKIKDIAGQDEQYKTALDTTTNILTDAYVMASIAEKLKVNDKDILTIFQEAGYSKYCNGITHIVDVFGSIAFYIKNNRIKDVEDYDERYKYLKDVVVNISKYARVISVWSDAKINGVLLSSYFSEKDNNGEYYVKIKLENIINTMKALSYLIKENDIKNVEGKEKNYQRLSVVVLSIISTMAKMTSSLNTNLSNIEKFIAYFPEYNDIDTKDPNIIKKFIKIIDNISDVLTNSFNDDLLESITNSHSILTDVNDMFDDEYVMIKTLVDNVIELEELIKSVNTETFDTKLSAIIESFNSAITKLSTISNSKSNVTDGGGFFADLGDKLLGKGVTITDDINLFCDVIERIIELSKQAAEAKEDGYEYIGDGIDYINEAVNNIQDQQTFEQHQKIMDKYVNTVNKIDVMKANKLINLVNAMNVLASRMGNLDNLTAAISDGLTLVLDKLVRELTTAKETIEKAEKLQKSRYDLIKSQVNDVKTIMSQTLTIEISKVEDNQSLNDNSTSVTTTNDQSNTNNNNNNGGGNPVSNQDNTTNQAGPDNINSNGGPTKRTKSQPDIATANAQRRQTTNQGMSFEQLEALLENKIPNRFKLDPRTNVITPIG